MNVTNTSVVNSKLEVFHFVIVVKARQSSLTSRRQMPDTVSVVSEYYKLRLNVSTNCKQLYIMANQVLQVKCKHM